MKSIKIAYDKEKCLFVVTYRKNKRTDIRYYGSLATLIGALQDNMAFLTNDT